jgi:ATP-dependent Clp protease ATP-binding subunit ClpC
LYGYNFTERVRKVLTLARDEAHARNHEYVGTEHILLGIVDEGGGVAVDALQNLRVDLSQIRVEMDKVVLSGKKNEPPRDDLPYTSRAKKVLELAMVEARDLNHNHVGTEHVMLGLIREEKGIAAQILNHLGVTLDSARQEVLRLMGAPPADGLTYAGSAVASLQSDSSAAPASLASGVTVDLRFANGAMIRRSFSEVADAITFLNGHAKKDPPG